MNWIAVPREPGEGRRDRHLAPPVATRSLRRDPRSPVPGPRACDAVAMSARPGRAMDGYPVPPPTMTDLYELTMAAGYWKLGRLDEEAIFTLFFRHAPFDGGFTLAAGLEGVIAFIERYAFSPPELAHLEGLLGNDDRPLFEPAFLDYLGGLRLQVDVDAMPEGTLAFPHEPLLRVSGPLLQAQLLESALLNLVNYPTLAATKAAHVVLAAGGATGHGVRAAPRPGPRRRPDGVARRLPRRLQRDLERAGRPPVRDPGPGHARALVGALVRQRAGGVRRLGRRHARQRRAPGRHLRHRGGHRERDRDRPPDARARPAAGGHPARLGRPRLPVGPRPRDARRGRVRGHPGRGLERPRPRHDGVAPGPGRAHRQLGRRDQARDLLRPAGAGRRVQADRDPQGGRRRGGRRSRSAPTPPRSPFPAGWRCAASTTPTARPART